MYINYNWLRRKNYYYVEITFLIIKVFQRFQSSTNQDASHLSPIVNCHNEWDPLEEIIVGHTAYATLPKNTPEVDSILADEHRPIFKEKGGAPFPSYLIKKASKEIEEFCNILRHEGVIVRRPDVMDFSKEFTTPHFKSTGMHAAMPRDLLLVIGDEIIEAPMAWRSRFFEYIPYRSLVKEYFSKGARWTTAPKPTMGDELYDFNYPPAGDPRRLEMIKHNKYVTTEFEPCFDAADVMRAGRDLFVQRSSVTNLMGIEWLKRHLGDRYNVHTVSFDDTNPMHIDASLNLLAPGIAIANPDLSFHHKDFFEKAGWKVVPAARSVLENKNAFLFCSNWLCMNILMLDEKRAIVESDEIPTQKMLESLGIECIKTSIRNANHLGGAFHCLTSDIRRTGELKSYF